MIESKENVKTILFGSIHHAVGQGPIPVSRFQPFILFHIPPADVLLDPAETSLSYKPNIPLDDSVITPPHKDMHTVLWSL
jgi:hypothetical protein